MVLLLVDFLLRQGCKKESKVMCIQSGRVDVEVDADVEVEVEVEVCVEVDVEVEVGVEVDVDVEVDVSFDEVEIVVRKILFMTSLKSLIFS